MTNNDMQDKKKEFYDRFTIEGDFPTRFELGGLKLANIVWGWLEYQLEEAEKLKQNKD